MYFGIEKEGQLIEYILWPLFVRWDAAAKMFVGCGEGQAEGIVSKDGETIYHIEGIESEGRFPGGEVTYRTVTEQEYEEVISQEDDQAELSADYLAGYDQAVLDLMEV